MHDVSHLLEPGETLEWLGAPAEHLHRHLGADLRYLITDRRVIIADETGMDSYAPGALTKLELRPADDGTADVVWDVVEHTREREHRAGLTIRLGAIRRDDRVGFLGVPDGDAVMQRLEAWLAVRNAEAAADAETAWTWHREPATGFTICMPASWQVRYGTTKEYKILGIRIQRPPQFTTRTDIPWNTLEATVPDMAIAVGVMLNPNEMPESLNAVLTSRLASLLNVRVISSEADLRIGGLQGFSVLQHLQGAAGVSVQLGETTMRLGGLKDRLVQRQVWLRGSAGNVHVQAVTPADADALRAVVDRSVASMRFGDPG